LVASTKRSGSHYLGHLLQATGRMGSPLEYLLHLPAWRDRLGAADEASALRELFRRRTSPNGWFGVKAHWDHFAELQEKPEVWALLRPERYIYIRRRDVLSQAISFVIAKQTKSWISWQKEEQAEPRFDAPAIARAIAAFERENRLWERCFTRMGISPVRIVYEDLVADPGESLNRALAECGLAPEPNAPAVDVKRQASVRNDVWRERFLKSEEAAMRTQLARLRLRVRDALTLGGGIPLP
jgi:LPS sulfotransferase NodH